MVLTPRRGMALMLAMLLGVLVLVLCIVLLNAVENDAHAAVTQMNETQAYYMAREGVTYFTIDAENFTFNVTRTKTPTVATQRFAVCIYNTGPSLDPTIQAFDLVADGIVTDLSGKIVATRRLIVPQGEMPVTLDKTR